MKNIMERILRWVIPPFVLCLIGMLGSCGTPERWIAEQQARHQSELIRIAADTIPRPQVVTPYYQQPLLYYNNYYQPYYWRNNVIRSNYRSGVRFTVPFRKRIRTKSRRTYVNRNRSPNSYRSRSSTNRSTNKKATIRRSEVKRIKNQNQKQK